jgi:hypothetical protein
MTTPLPVVANKCGLCGYTGPDADHLGQCPQCHWDELQPITPIEQAIARLKAQVQWLRHGKLLDGCPMMAVGDMEVILAALTAEHARGIDSPEGVETQSGSTAKPQEPGGEGTRPGTTARPEAVSQGIPQGVEARLIERLKEAVEGECDGLALTDDHARAILEYVLQGEQKL